jgi:exodeoxyribonuclease VII small subunit
MAERKKLPVVDYQALNEELQTILAGLQRDDLDIDEALQSYERGLKIIKQLDQYLTGAENRVTELKAAFQDKL